MALGLEEENKPAHEGGIKSCPMAIIFFFLLFSHLNMLYLFNIWTIE